MAHISPEKLSDRDLLAATADAADRERHTTAELLALLAELDTRKLYLGAGYSSLFTYCTQALHLSEPAAYSRITAARTARRFPIILTLLADGAVTLTTVGLLAAHLTDENYEVVLDAAQHKSRREIERLVASLDPQPDIPSSVRKVGGSSPANGPALLAFAEPPIVGSTLPAPMPPGTAHQITIAAPGVTAFTPRSFVGPLTPERYLLKVTISRDAHEKLERARALARHTNPDGDLATIVERAISVFREQLEKRRLAATSRPRPRASASRTSRTRHIPGAITRNVWTRDAGRCAFIGSHGRCTETAFLELHHVRPFAVGGQTTADNLQLRCRSHNMHEAVCLFGDRKVPVARSAVAGPTRPFELSAGDARPPATVRRDGAGSST